MKARLITEVSSHLAEIDVSDLPSLERALHEGKYTQVLYNGPDWVRSVVKICTPKVLPEHLDTAKESSSFRLRLQAAVTENPCTDHVVLDGVHFIRLEDNLWSIVGYQTIWDSKTCGFMG